MPSDGVREAGRPDAGAARRPPPSSAPPSRPPSPPRSSSCWRGCTSPRSSTRTSRPAASATGAEPMPLYRYSRWDGTQKIDLDADELHVGDGRRPARTTAIRGARSGASCSRAPASPKASRMPGLKDLLEQLQAARSRSAWSATTSAPAWTTSRRSSTTSCKTEREGIEAAHAARGQRAPREREQKLGRASPPDPAGQLRELQKYDFVDPEAKQKFEELLNSLRQQMMQPFMFGAMQQALQEHDAARPGAHARDDAGPQPHAAAEGRGRGAGLRRLQGRSGASTSRASRASTSSSSRWAGRWRPCSRSCRASRPSSAQQLDEMMRVAPAPGRAAGGADAPARHEPGRVPPARRDGPALSVPRRRGGLAPGGHAPHGRDAADRRARARDPRRARAGGPRAGRSRARSSSCWARRRPRISSG